MYGYYTGTAVLLFFLRYYSTVLCYICIHHYIAVYVVLGTRYYFVIQVNVFVFVFFLFLITFTFQVNS